MTALPYPTRSTGSHPTGNSVSCCTRSVRSVDSRSKKLAGAYPLSQPTSTKSGRRIPLGAIQTFVIWKLNTSPRPRLTVPRHRDEGSVLAAGLPAGAFVATALVTLIYHFGQPATPQTLAEYIAKSAPCRFIEKADFEAYQAYADKLKATLLTHFNEDERSRIFGQHTSIAEPLLAE